jgi:hypothetical protein
LQLLLNPFRDFDGTWYKGRSNCGEVHIVREPCPINFQGVMPPELSILKKKYFVFAI